MEAMLRSTKATPHEAGRAFVGEGSLAVEWDDAEASNKSAWIMPARRFGSCCLAYRVRVSQSRLPAHNSSMQASFCGGVGDIREWHAQYLHYGASVSGVPPLRSIVVKFALVSAAEFLTEITALNIRRRRWDRKGSRLLLTVRYR